MLCRIQKYCTTIQKHKTRIYIYIYRISRIHSTTKSENSNKEKMSYIHTDANGFTEFCLVLSKKSRHFARRKSQYYCCHFMHDPKCLIHVVSNKFNKEK